MPERGQILILAGGRPAERWRGYTTPLPVSGRYLPGAAAHRTVLTQAFARLNSASAAGLADAAAAAGWVADTFGTHGGFAVAAMATGVMAALAVAGLRALPVPQQHAATTQLAE
jgi:hypothetical protein